MMDDDDDFSLPKKDFQPRQLDFDSEEDQVVDRFRKMSDQDVMRIRKDINRNFFPI